MKKIILSFISFSFIVGLFFTSNNVNALEDITIYNSSFGKILELTDKEMYDSLPEDEKNYFNSLPAEKILGEDDSNKEITIYNTMKKNSVAREPNVIAVLTQAFLVRKDSKTLTFGGTYSATYPIGINEYAYLIRKSDGRLMKTTTCKSKSSTGETKKTNASINKTNESYYCRATGIYVTKTMGTKSTSQCTIAYH